MLFTHSYHAHEHNIVGAALPQTLLRPWRVGGSDSDTALPTSTVAIAVNQRYSGHRPVTHIYSQVSNPVSLAEGYNEGPSYMSVDSVA